MKYVRFIKDNEVFYGRLQGDQIEILTGDLFNDYTLTGTTVACKDVQLLAPCEPSKAVCVGLNYLDHALEMKEPLPEEPLLFLKPSTAVTAPAGDIIYPPLSKNLHYEAELAVVIKKTAKNVKAENYQDYVLGYTCANDVTARDLQKKDGQWTRGKSFDTFLPLGPCIETEVEPGNLDICLTLNGEVHQSSNTSQLIFAVPTLIEKITQVMTLNPGDVILTGTTSGVGPMNPGDVVAVEIKEIGRLVNTVRE